MELIVRRWSWRASAMIAAVALSFLCPALAQSPKPAKSAKPKDVREAMRKNAVREAQEAKEKRERITNRSDEPAEAAKYFVESRTPYGENIDLRVQLENAAAALANNPVYSTTKGKLLSKKAATEAVETASTGWAPLGPGNIGGRTRAMLIDRKDNNLMWVAGVAGGIWKSTDGGATWIPKGDQLANIAVNSMIQHPKLDNVLFAGTGEGFLNADGVRGGGIYISTDYGDTWTQLPSTINNSSFYYVNKLATSKDKKDNRLYAATRAGILRSTDYGQTWELVVNAFTTTTPAGESYYAGCFDIALQEKIEDINGNPDNSIFATCGTIYGTAELGAAYHNPAILRAKDVSGPQTWEVVHSTNTMARTSLAIAPSNENVIYALAAAHNITEPGFTGYVDGMEAVYRSTDGGSTWEARTTYKNPTRLNTLLLSNTVYGMYDLCGWGPAPQFINQGWYDNIIVVDPKDSNVVWAGGIDLFRSDDGGANWGAASYWWFPKGYPGYAHADQHMILFHPKYNGASNRMLYVTSDGGLFATSDAKATVAYDAFTICGNEDQPDPKRVMWSELNNGYAVTQFYHGTMYPDGATYFGGTQDNGTVRGNLTDGASWQTILGGDGGYVAVNPTNTNILYAENYSKSLKRSTNGGVTFSSIGPSDSSGNYLFIHPFAMDPANPNIIWYGGAAAYRSNNGGTSWTAASNFFSARISAWAVSGNRAYAAARLSGNNTYDGRIWTTGVATTATSATAWQSKQPRTGQVGSLTMDPTNPLVVWATYMTYNSGVNAGHVFKLTVDATTGAMTSTLMDGTGDGIIPNIPAHSIAIDPDNTNRMYVATDLGVFVTIDGGLHWYQENAGFANVITELVEVKTVADGKYLYAFTHGRSAWRLKLN